MTTAHRIADPATISALIAMQEAAGFHDRVIPYRAALAGEFQLIDVPPRCRIPADVLWPNAPKTLVIVADDAGLSRGPADWPQARRLLAWARFVAVNAIGARELEYRAATTAAATYGRSLLIETNTASQAAWEAITREEWNRRQRAGIPQLAVLLSTVPPGSPAHPLVEGAQHA